MSLNIIDKAVMYVSPERGLRRSVARQALSITWSNHTRYAAAMRTRLRDNRTSTNVGPDVLTERYMVELRSRARAQARDSGLAKRMVELWVNHLIGEGFATTFAALAGGKTAAKRQNDTFVEWFGSTLCDSTGLSDGHALFSLATAIMVRDGNAFIRRVIIGRDHPDFKRMKVPAKLQVLEPDFLDINRNGEAENGNPIVMGIEYDKKYPDVRVAYWLFDQHPGERSWKRWATNYQSTRVPADEIIHLFVRDRNNSLGVTWFHAILETLEDFSEYLDALRMKAKIEACFSLVITSQSNTGQNAPVPAGQGDSDYIQSDDEITPGIIRYARPGDQITPVDPSNSSGHSVLVSTLIRLAAVGMGLTYDQAYSDLTGANYSSLRAGKMEFNRAVRQKQSLILYPAAVRVAEWFLEAGQLASLWKTSDSPIEITFDPPDVVDPMKDGAAERADVEFGLDTFAERIKARGKNPVQHITALKEEIDFFKATFGEDAQHPFLQMLLKLSAKAPPGTADGAPEDDENAPPTRSSA